MHHPTPRASIRAVRRLSVCLATLIGLLTLVFSASPAAHAAGEIYVRSAAIGANDGTSWADAYISLQSALSAASSGDEIWVAVGTYTPSATGDRSASFTLKDGVAVYGGFVGTETLLSQRSWTTNVTTLSGDIGTVGDASDNSYHVVTGATGATLDGFMLSGGNASGSGTNTFGGGVYNSSSAATLSNLIISDNSASNGGAGIYNDNSNAVLTNVSISSNTASYGGGIYNDNASSAVLTNVTISGNTAANNGGGMYNTLSSPTLTNVVLSGNLANQGGGIYNVSTSSPTLTNVTIADNRSSGDGGGLYNSDSNSQIRNSIIWGNRAGSGANSIHVNSGTPVVSYSLVEGAYTGTGNLNSDPRFVGAVAAASAPTVTGDYHLGAGSPTLDAGDNGVTNPSLPATDRDGNTRRIDVLAVADTGSGSAPLVDMGAYETTTTNVSSISRFDPATSFTTAMSVTFQVIFVESLSGVDISDFTPILVSGQTVGSSVTAVSGSGTTWQVTVNPGNGAGVLRLDMSSTAWVTNAGGMGVGIESFTGGEVYTFDTPPPAPVISSITTDYGTWTGGTTIDPTISLNGTAEANSTVTLSRADIGVIGTITANGIGVWSFDYTGTSLPLGSYSFTAIATDAGGSSPASSTFVVTVANASLPELMYYRFDAAGTSVVNEATLPVGTNPAPILGQTIGNSGQFGSALVGTGGASNTDYVNTGWAPNLGTGSWTISFWTSNVPSSSTVFYFFGDINSNSLRAFTNGVAGAGNVILRGGGMTDVLVTGAATSEPNVVHFVYDSTVPEIRAYKNGVLVNTVPQSSVNINGSGPFKVGGYSSSTSLASGQLFDEFRLYNRALPAEEVSATWDQALPLLPTITLTKSVEPAVARPGDLITYTITFSNTGNGFASNLLITDTLSSDITNSSVATSGIALTQAPGSPYAWSAPSLAPNSVGVITITGTLASPLASGILTNTVLLSTTEVTKTAEVPVTILNVAPVAQAGTDQRVDNNQVITLDGSGSSDANGDSLIYGWVQTGGPLVSLSDPTASSPIFTSPATNTVLTFALMVTDSLGLADPTPDEVVYETNSCFSYVSPYAVPGDSAALSRAITCANLDSDANVINLTNSTYTFTTGDASNGDSALPRITTPMIINGNGAIIERDNGAPDFRLLYVSGGGNLTLKNVTLRGGSSDQGGGIYNGSVVTLINSTLSGNTASNNGGGLHNSSATINLVSSSVSGNSAGANGGGVYNFGTMTVINSTISGNAASADGGGLYNVVFSSISLFNSTIAGNNGAGLYNNNNATVRNSIIYGNSSQIDGSRTTDVTYSTVEGGYSGTGNQGDDPLFENPVAYSLAPTTFGDYHLQSSSPAMNTGDNATLPSDAYDLDGNNTLSETIPYDRDSNARIVDTTVDMGAYERQALASTPNLVPALDELAGLTILEDAGAQTVSLSGISAGASESQTLSITAVSSNPALIPNPNVSYTSPNATGSLSFTPAANASGTATITVTLRDNGGTADGGVDTLTRSFTVTVTAVNDAPNFTAGPNQTVQASAGLQTVPGWASSFTPGPADESGQTVLGYTVVSNSASELFTIAPAIDTSGRLTYTPKPGARGTATIGVVVRDNGGTANGGVDTSAMRTFTITVGGNYMVYLPLVLRS